MKDIESRRAMRVIALDDDEITLGLYEESFKAHPYPVEYLAFTDGNKALEEMNRCMPDLLITYWQMPIMSGAVFLERVFQVFDTSNTAVLVVSGDDLMGLQRGGSVPYAVEILKKDRANSFERISEIAQCLLKKIE